MSVVLQKQLLAERRHAGIYAVCSAHPWVIEAAALQALEDGTSLLVEATSNQVNQDGGYTGMQPSDFRSFVGEIAEGVGVPVERLYFGGDHLGPNPWSSLNAVEAMKRACRMVDQYARAGFTKIHLDASMPCLGDPEVLSDEIVA
ncbi:class II D-tagatose-bisphosphate aldolase, non-catalytic subunit, partial [Terriglobus sp. YAF25]